AFLPSQVLSMNFTRFVPAGLDHRFQLGPFGRGWTHNFEISLSQIATNIVDLALPNGTHRPFYRQPDQSWLAGPGDLGTLQSLGGGAFVLQETDGLTEEFDGQGRLVVLQEQNGNQITLTYSSGNLTAITHSDGQQFTL